MVVPGMPEAPMGVDCGTTRPVRSSNSGIGVFGGVDSALFRHRHGSPPSHQRHPAPMPPLESIPATPTREAPPLGSKPVSLPKPARPLLIPPSPAPPHIQCQHYPHCPQFTQHPQCQQNPQWVPTSNASITGIYPRWLQCLRTAPRAAMGLSPAKPLLPPLAPSPRVTNANKATIGSIVGIRRTHRNAPATRT